MQLARLPSWTYTVIAAVPVVILVSGDFLFFYSAGYEPGMRMAIAALIIIWMLAFSFIGWKRLDEPGRSAHKDAWFWGGSSALLVALLSVAVVHFVPAGGALVDGAIASWTSKWPEGQGGFALGVLFAAIAQVIGYFLAWAAWWLAKRR